jgi:CheY-like chemotaxis protein
VKTVLVLNDYPPHSALIALELLLLDHQVVTTTTAEEALDTACKLSPTLLIVDINLGENGNLEALPDLRQNSCLHDTPILVISSRRDKTYYDRALSAGGDVYLVKPFGHQQFKEAIKRCFEHHHPN